MSELETPIIADATCPTVGYQTAAVCVPVVVTPFARTGTTATKCCGSAVVRRGKDVCPGIRNGACHFTISQNICVAIPVGFGATAAVGDAYVDCMDASSDDISDDCALAALAATAAANAANTANNSSTEPTATTNP